MKPVMNSRRLALARHIVAVREQQLADALETHPPEGEYVSHHRRLLQTAQEMLREDEARCREICSCQRVEE